VGFCGCIQDMAVYAPTLYTLSLTPSGVIGKEDDLFIMDYDSKYLEYYFRIGN
jgi:hypothetical protein